MPSALITDYPWPDLQIETAILSGAGLALVAGPSRVRPAEVIEALCAEHDPVGIMCCWAPLTAAAIANAPSLRHIARLGVGLDNIDVAAATARGVVVTNVPDYCIEEVSDHAVALLMAWARGLIPLDKEVKAGRWPPATVPLYRLRSLTAGVVGYGRIGRCVAQKLAAYGLPVLACGRSAISDPDPGVQAVEFEALLAASDAVLICAPLTEDTRHLFDAERLARMKPGAFLVNVTRGAIVDPFALALALERGHLAGAGLDVVEGEPDPPPILTGRADVIVTPHVAFSSPAALTELRTRVSEEIVRVWRGQPPEHPCNTPAD